MARAHRRLFVALRREHRWAALLDNERVVEFHAEEQDDNPRVGDIYLARIVRVDKGLGAAFLDIGRDTVGFMPLGELAAPAIEGARTVVQVQRESRGDKGPRVTARPAFAGARLVLLPGRRGVSLSERIPGKAERSRLSALMKTVVEAGEGFAVRTSAVGAKENELRDEAAALRASWRDLLDKEQSRQPPSVLQRQPPIDLRLLRDQGASVEGVFYDDRRAADAAVTWCRTILRDLAPPVEFRRSIDWQPTPAEIFEQVEDAVQARVSLRSGGSIMIEATEAMTVIDVNADAAGTASPADRSERVLLRTNLAAAEEIARQIRLRNVGGIVVVDFIDLKEMAARRQVVDRLRAVVALDSAPIWVGPMSRLGLVELTRRRRGPTLIDVLTRRCSACEGRGRVRRDQDAFPAMDAR